MICRKNLFRLGSFLFVFLLFAFLASFFSNSVQAADEKKKDDHGAPPPDPHAAPLYIPPLPRHVTFPVITYGKEPSVEGETALNLSKMRFWYIAILASWNPRSGEISEILNQNYKLFSMRNVGVIALYSNDTIESIEAWRKKNNPLYLNVFASRNLLDELKNPKIPTVWVVGSEGEILQRMEMPTKQNILQSVQKVMILTGF